MNYKYLVSILLFLYCLYYACTLDSWHFIDNVNLIIHEAGHVLFMPFGEFLHILGGSLLQVILPTIFVIYFVLKQQFFSASLVLYWVGINLLNVSVYAGDALTMQLPLLTGDTEGHDWNQLLFRLGWLRHTELISEIIFYIGIVLILCAFVWGLYLTSQKIYYSI